MPQSDTKSSNASQSHTITYNNRQLTRVHTHTCTHTRQTNDPKLQKANILSSKTATVSSVDVTVRFLYGWHHQQQEIVHSRAILVQCYVVNETQLATHPFAPKQTQTHHHSARSISAFPPLPPKRKSTAIKDQATVSKSGCKQDVSADTENSSRKKKLRQVEACTTPVLVCVPKTLLALEAHACK